MLTLPTRAKFVETQLGASIYGSKMMFEMHEAMLRATAAGRSKVLYHFDKGYLSDPKAKLLNSLFIEYLKSKKYKIDKETRENFIVYIK